MNSTSIGRLSSLFQRRLMISGTALLVSFLLLVLCPTALLAFKCNVTATGLAFGNYDSLNPVSTNATADIGVTCSIKAKNKSAPLVVTVSVDTGSSGSFSQRYMTSVSGAGVLNYNMYMDAAGINVWGDGSGGTSNRVVNVTKESPFNAKIYGKIPAGQNIPAGSYSDAITVTVLW